MCCAGYAHAQPAADLELCVGPAGTVDERIAACTRALKTRKLPVMDQAVAYRNRAEHWSDKREHKRALADLNEAIRLHPQYAQAYVYRGNAHVGLGDHDRAIADYTEALRLNPRDEVAYNNRGNAWSEKGNHDRAIADYGEAILLNPRGASTWRNRGAVWRSKGDHDKAIADFNEAIRLEPEDVFAYQNRAEAWLGKNNPSRALDDFNQALKLDPDNSARLNRLAWLLATSKLDALRDGKRAVELARRACELTAWKEMNYIDTFAAAHAAAGNFKEAVQWQEKALRDKKLTKDTGARERLELYRVGKAFRE